MAWGRGGKGCAVAHSALDPSTLREKPIACSGPGVELPGQSVMLAWGWVEGAGVWLWGGLAMWFGGGTQVGVTCSCDGCSLQLFCSLHNGR